MSGRGGSGSKRGFGGGGGGGGVDKEKPWASGRVLTAEQRARKQEADRKANRFLKKEVQDRLATLELRVRELEQEKSTSASNNHSKPDRAGPYQDPTIGPAPSVCDNVYRIPSKVSKWIPSVDQSTAQTGLGAQFARTLPTITRSDSQISDGIRMAVHAEQSTADASGSQSGPSDVEELKTEVSTDLSDVHNVARTRLEGRHMTCFLNNLVNYVRSLRPEAVCFDDVYNQDLVASALMRGWEETLCRYPQRCPLWDVLRLVDTYLFRESSIMMRLGSLRMLHKRYLFEVNANLPAAGPPPPWYRPQFCEKVFFHDPVIDHLTWPTLRERLVSSETDRLTNRFWILWGKHLRVTWHHEPVDSLSYSHDTQLYTLDPSFEASLLDIDNWRMDMGFFRGLPQLAGDVPPYNYMPLRSLSPKFGGRERGQHPHELIPKFGLQQTHEEQPQSQPGRQLSQPGSLSQTHQLQPQAPNQMLLMEHPSRSQSHHQPPYHQQQQQQQQQQPLPPPALQKVDIEDAWMRDVPDFMSNIPPLDSTKYNASSIATWNDFYP